MQNKYVKLLRIYLLYWNNVVPKISLINEFNLCFFFFPIMSTKASVSRNSCIILDPFKIDAAYPYRCNFFLSSSVSAYNNLIICELYVMFFFYLFGIDNFFCRLPLLMRRLKRICSSCLTKKLILSITFNSLFIFFFNKKSSVILFVFITFCWQLSYK